MDENRGGPSEQLSLTRKQLYDMVWSTPMMRLARQFHCSSTWLARICREASVPVPPRGYWAKKRAGKAAQRRGLPRSADPDEVVVSYTPPDATEEFDSQPPPPPPPPPPPLDDDLQALRSQIEQAGPIAVPTELNELHPVVARTRRALQAAAAQHRENHGLLQPHWVHDGCLIDLEVSATAADRAIRLFAGLFRALQQLGGSIVAKGKHPQVKILGDLVEFRIRERPKMRRLTPEEMKDRWAGKIRWEGSGVFDLLIKFDPELGYHTDWHDGRKGQLESQLRQILLDIVDRIQDGRRWRLGAPARERERQRKLEEERQRELERFRVQQEERLEAERVALLMELAAQHAKAMKLRSFLAACKATPAHSGADDRWLAWGERVLADLDPLSDGIAGIRATPRPYGPPLFSVFGDEVAGR